MLFFLLNAVCVVFTSWWTEQAFKIHSPNLFMLIMASFGDHLDAPLPITEDQEDRLRAACHLLTRLMKDPMSAVHFMKLRGLGLLENLFDKDLNAKPGMHYAFRPALQLLIAMWTGWKSG